MNHSDNDRLVTIARFRNDFDANLALTRLQSEGIRCILDGEGAAGVWGGALGMTFTPIKLLVFCADAEKALAIIRGMGVDIGD